MKLNKRTGAVLGFLLAVTGGAVAATGWATNYTWTYDTLKKEPVPVVMATDDNDGTWTTVKTGVGLPVQGPTASCANYRATTTSVTAGSSGTSIDTGATGTGYWTAAKNLSRTFDIQISTDTGSVRIGPGDSVTLSKPNAATADSVTVATNCTGCGGAATNVSVITCDDD